jgi:hypothetical protein
LFIAGLLAAAGCQTLGAGGNGRCAAAFPRGLRGSPRTVVQVIYTYNVARHWDDAERMSVMGSNADRVRETLAGLAAQNLGGPQFQFVPQGQPFDVWLTVMVDGNQEVIDYPDDDGTPGKLTAATTDWAAVYASGMGYKALFSFTTHSYPYGMNPYAQRELYDEAASQAYGFLANGWTCGGGARP